MNPPLFDLAYCPIVPALEVIGGKWKPLVVYHVYSGTQRFGDLLRKMPSISKTMLTLQLRELERDGLLHREVFTEVPPRVEYTLTERGMTLLPVLRAIGAWGRQLVENDLPECPAISTQVADYAGSPVAVLHQ